MKRKQVRKTNGNWKTQMVAKIAQLEKENEALKQPRPLFDNPKTDVGCATDVFLNKLANPVSKTPLVLVLSPEEQNSKILLAAFHSFGRCIEKLKSKNKDYATDRDEFSNFHDEEMGLAFEAAHVGFNSTMLSIRNLIKTKMKRYLNLSSKQHRYIGANESIQDTREDLINYLVIDKAWEDRY